MIKLKMLSTKSSQGEKACIRGSEFIFLEMIESTKQAPQLIWPGYGSNLAKVPTYLAVVDSMVFILGI